jgi:hypothetical protein
MDDLKQMFGRPITWLAIAVFTALACARAILAHMAMVNASSSADALRMFLVTTAIGLCLFIARIVLRYVLSRRLGNPDGSASDPATGLYVSYVVAYEFVFAVLTSGLPFAIAQFRWSPKLLVLASDAARILLAVILFTFAVRMVALAHGSPAMTLRRIRKSVGLPWHAALMAIMLASSFLTYSLGANHPAAPFGAVLSGCLNFGFAQVLLMLLAIAAYRHAARKHGDMSGVFA